MSTHKGRCKQYISRKMKYSGARIYLEDVLVILLPAGTGLSVGRVGCGRIIELHMMYRLNCDEEVEFH